MTNSKKFAVVGSGPGGSLSAALLAEHGQSVVVFEDGGQFANLETEAFTQKEIEKKYRNGGVTAAFGNPKVTFVEGRTVGGGSEINAGLYQRIPLQTLERWRINHRLDLAPPELEGFYQANESELEIQTPTLQDLPPAGVILHRGCELLNWKSQLIPRWYWNDKNQIHRHSMSALYIPRACKAGATVKPNHFVRKIRQTGSAWDLEVCHDGGITNYNFDAVVLAGGATQSPSLLRRSGWRAPIGDGLYFHPTLKVVAEFPHDTNSNNSIVAPIQVKEFSPQMSFGCSITKPQTLALAMLDHYPELAKVLKNWRRHSIFYVMVNVESFGRVRTMGDEAVLKYKMAGADKALLFRGLGKLCELLFSAGAIRLYPSISNGSSLTEYQPRSFEQPNSKILRSLQISTVHLMGSCPMGENEALCPLDSFGEVRNCKNLWVNDASMLCTSLGVNPQGAIMALTRRNCLNILGRL